MNVFKLVLYAAINAFLLAAQRPIEAQSRMPAVETKSPSPTPTVETEASFPNTILETIDFDADAGLKDLNVARLTKSLTQRHWDNDDWVEELQQRVVVAWQALGYFKAEADVSGRRVRKSPQERVYAVTVKVHAGKQYRLGEIHVVNAKEFTSD
jgi:outer membrane translocation and assembly module TamA